MQYGDGQYGGGQSFNNSSSKDADDVPGEGGGGDDGDGGGGGFAGDQRTLWARHHGQDVDGAHRYDHVGHLRMDWNYAKRDSYNPYLATDNGEDVVQDPKADATRVYHKHRVNDADKQPHGSLADVFDVPCRIHGVGPDEDGNPTSKLVQHIDKSEWYHTDQAHGETHHIGLSRLPGRGAQVWETVAYFHKKTHKLRWKTWSSGGSRPSNPNPPPTPGTPTPPPTPPPPGPTGNPTTPNPYPSEPPPTPSSPVPTEPTPYGGSPGVPGWSGGVLGDPTTDGSGDLNDPFGDVPAMQAWGMQNVNTFGDPEATEASTEYGSDPFGEKLYEVPLPGVEMQSTEELEDVEVADLRAPRFGMSQSDGYPNVRRRLYSPKWYGERGFEVGLEPYPSFPGIKWYGDGPPTDAGLLTDQPTTFDWTTAARELLQRFTQDDYDTISMHSERKAIWDRINALADYLGNLSDQFRSFVPEAQTVTIPAASRTVTVITTTPTADANQPFVAFGGHVNTTAISAENFSQQADSTWTFDVRIPFAAVGSGYEVSVLMMAPVQRSTTLSVSSAI